MTNSTRTTIEQLIRQLEIAQSYLLPGYSEVIRQVDETIAKARATLAAEPPTPIISDEVREAFAELERRQENFNRFRELRKDLAAKPPAPDPRETIAVRPLLEEVVALDVWGVELYDGRQAALQQRIRAWLAENPPGQPVAIEPRGCPTPGACSCVEPPAPAPAADGASSPTPEEIALLWDASNSPSVFAGLVLARWGSQPHAPVPVADGEREELAQWLDEEAKRCAAQFHDRITRAAALLRQSAPVQVPVPVVVSQRLPGPEDCDVEGQCWVGFSAQVDQTGDFDTEYSPSWELCQVHPQHEVWLPHWAIPVPQPPQGGEVE